jgi:DNA polymerase-4
MPRDIIHVNITNFYVSVARIMEPRLVSYPVAVVSVGATRPMVLDVSDEALRAGVRRGMVLERARRRCRDLVVVPPMPDAYRRAGNALVKEAACFSPRVEPAGPGHVFIDLSGTGRLWGPSVDVADRLRKRLQNRCSLPGSVGLGGSKLVSKVATRVVKPAGLCHVVHGCEESFLAPLPVHLLPGIDYHVVRQLLEFNLNIIKDIHGITPEVLSHALGTVAFDLYRFACGDDPAPVREHGVPAPVIEEETPLREQTNDEALLHRELIQLVLKAGIRLRRLGLATRKLVLSITYSDGSTASRTERLPAPICGDFSLSDEFCRLFRSVRTRRIRLSWMRIVLHELSAPYGQMDLFIDSDREERLMNAFDRIREHYGMGAIQFGNLLQEKTGARQHP